VLAGEDQAARAVELGDPRGDRVEDRVVERVALGRVGDGEPDDALGRLVDEELAYSNTTSVSPSLTD